MKNKIISLSEASKLLCGLPEKDLREKVFGDVDYIDINRLESYKDTRSYERLLDSQITIECESRKLKEYLEIVSKYNRLISECECTIELKKRIVEKSLKRFHKVSYKGQDIQISNIFKLKRLTRQILQYYQIYTVGSLLRILDDLDKFDLIEDSEISEIKNYIESLGYQKIDNHWV